MVSVIVPIYNVEKYLNKCLSSLKEQTYSDLQIILVNDGSTDNCKEICQAFCLRDSRFQLINKINEGLGYARNTGLEYAEGSHIVFVDSDDYFDKNMISTLMETANKYNADTVIGSFERVMDDGFHDKSYRQNTAIYVGKEVKTILLPKLFGSLPEGGDAVRMSVCNVLYSANIIKNNHLRFCSEREFTSEDLFFNLDYYCHAQSVYILSESLYYYRYNPSSLSNKYRGDRYEMKRTIYVEGCRRLKECGAYEQAKLRFMKYYFVGIRMCIRQETPEISPKNKRQCMDSIKIICEDNILRSILLEYPIRRLGMKQQVFLMLIKFKAVRLLLMLSRWGYLN